MKKILSIVSLFAILVYCIGCSISEGTAPAALGAAKLEQASQHNWDDYQLVVNTLSDNMTLMFSKQLQLLAEREMRVINLNPDATVRAEQTSTLLDNQELARTAFMEKLNTMRNRLLNAPNFKLAVKLSGSVSKYLGELDATANDIQSIFDQFQSAPAVDATSATLKSLTTPAPAGATTP